MSQDDERRALINAAHLARIELESLGLVRSIMSTGTEQGLRSFRARMHEWVDSWGVAERLTPPGGSTPPNMPGSPAAAAAQQMAMAA